MKKKNGKIPSVLSMFKENLGFPMNESAQMYIKSKDLRKSMVRQTRTASRGTGNPNAYQGGGGGGPPMGEEGEGRA